MIRLPWTLSAYLGRQFLVAILSCLLGLVVIVSIADFVELIRRTASKEVGFGVVLEMALLKMPDMATRLLPFAVLLGSMLALTRMTRTSELVVTRGAGVSAWQFLLPPLAITALMALFAVTVFNPVSSAMLSRFEQLEARYISGKPSLLAVSSSGLWLRQIEGEESPIGEYMFHAMRVSQRNMELGNVIVFAFDAHSAFIRRLDAKSAILDNGYWRLSDVVISTPGLPPEHQDSFELKTDLTLAEIQDSFASPMTLSFWELPSFIHTLEKAGFSALRHRLHWHALMAGILLQCGLVLLAAVFSLRLPRRGGVLGLVAAGVLTGFLLYFLTDIIYALGSAGTLPIALAAWTPAAVTLMMGAGLLLHLEDG